MKNDPTDGHVIVFPARTREVEGMRIFYLFSIRQVAEVLVHTDVQPVPFAPRHAEGLTQWRGRVIPVMSLEHCLGIRINGEQMLFRTVVARTITKNRDDSLSELYAVFKVGAAIRQMNLPLICEPTRVPDWITNASVLSGAYKFKDRLYLVMDMEAILTANIAQDRYVS